MQQLFVIEKPGCCSYDVGLMAVSFVYNLSLIHISTPTSPWQPTSAPEMEALVFTIFPTNPAVARARKIRVSLTVSYTHLDVYKRQIRTLTRWIKRNSELYAELLLTGYHARVRTFMPRQVGIIVRYLNEP